MEGAMTELTTYTCDLCGRLWDESAVPAQVTPAIVKVDRVQGVGNPAVVKLHFCARSVEGGVPPCAVRFVSGIKELCKGRSW